MAFFLIVAGFTGSLLAFNQELLVITQPWRVVEPPSANARLLDPLTLNRAALAAAPQGYQTAEGLQLDVEPERALLVYVAPPEGSDLDYLGVAVDPYTARPVHFERSNSILDGWHNIMPFVFQLHYKLAINGYGIWAFGIAALIWTLDCFVGFYLSLPIARSGWWKSWGKSWRVRWRNGSYKLNFDLHRAGGLWFWPALLVFAWSSVGMNLRDVYDPVMGAFGAESIYKQVSQREVPAGFKPDWNEAYKMAKGIAKAEGITVVRESALYFNYEGSGVYAYQFTSDRDFTDEDGWSWIYFFPDGRVERTVIADGSLRGSGADQWFTALHRAEVWGLPYRIYVAALGLAITMLSVTGVIIWMRKRSARLLGRTRGIRKQSLA